MRISKPIEIEENTFRLRLEGSILTVTPIIVTTHPNEPTDKRDGTPAQKNAAQGILGIGDEPNPYAIIAHLMKELAK